MHDIFEASFEIKAVTDLGEFEGHAGVFNNTDLGNDILMPGSTTKSLKKSKGIIPVLQNHNPNVHIGFNKEAKEDSRGMAVKGQLNLDVQAGREQYALAKQAKELGQPIGLSIGYRVIKHTYEGVIRKLQEVDIVEYSFTPFPMNPKARVRSIKDALGYFDDAEFKIVEETENEVRIRIKDPGLFQSNSFRRTTLKSEGPKVFAIIGRLKGETSTTVQSLRFPKDDGWTKSSATKWAKDHDFETGKSHVVEEVKDELQEPLIYIPELLVKDVREMEISLRDEGFSHSQSKMVAGRFFNNLRDEELEKLSADIKTVANIFKN